MQVMAVRMKDRKMDDPYNPEFMLGGCIFRLSEICHGSGMKAYWLKGKDAYLSAYYETLNKLCPEHPALRDYHAENAQGVMDV
jgi:hypothetical protein